jgi:membrane protein implicated in regulation of membrane protease activity
MKKLLLFLFFILFLISEVSAQETGKIEGHVLDMKNGPMSKVTVYLDNITTSVETDENGYFVIEQVPVGKHIVIYESTGWAFPESLVLVKSSSDGKPLEVNGELKWWAYISVYNIYMVILLLTFVGNFLILVEYYVMPVPTKVLGPMGIITGVGSIAIAVTKTAEIYLSISFVLITLLSLTLCLKLGQAHSKKMHIEQEKKKEEIELKEAEKKDQFKDLIGKEGVAITDFNLVGKVEIDKKIYDGKSRTEFIKKGQKICILEVSGNMLIVEKGSYSKYT